MENDRVKREICVKKGLSENDLIDIKDLLKVCEEYDSSDINKFSLPPKDESNEYLIYKEDKIIAFLGIHPSSTSSEVKITGKVHPSYRRKGIFSELINKAKDICKIRKLKTMVLINEHSLENGRAFCIYLDGKLKYTTYKMDFSNDYYTEKIDCLNNLVFRTAKKEDENEIIKLGMEAFGTIEEDERSYFIFNMNNSDRNVYVGKLDGSIMSTVTVVIQNKEARICDLSVLKNYRKQGIGRTMLLEVVNELRTQGVKNISLFVETNNQNALSLYEGCGFKVVGSNDFYEVVLA